MNKKSDENIVRTTIYVPADLKEKIRVEAFNRRTTETAIIKEALTKYFERENESQKII